MRHTRLIVLLFLMGVGALACYTRLNHPLLRQESRLFTPDLNSDCAACHAGEDELLALRAGEGGTQARDPLHAFREGAWWTSGGGHHLTEAGGASLPTPPPPAPLPSVMGSSTGGARREAALARQDSVAQPTDSSAAPRRPARPRQGRGAVKTTPPDTLKKGL